MVNKRFESLKAFSDIVDAMVGGLKREWVNVRMYSFGHAHESICYGCAATNTLCQLMGEPFHADNISSAQSRADQFNYQITRGELNLFEYAIDSLRQGELYQALHNLNQISYLFSFKMPELKDIRPPFHLPVLGGGDNWRGYLHIYEEYKDWLKLKGL